MPAGKNGEIDSSILGLYGDSGKENGNYYKYNRVYIGLI